MKLSWFTTWLLSHLFGSNWKANLVNAFKLSAERYFAGSASLSQAAVTTWAETHVATIADDLAKGNPMYAALLIGAAEEFVPAIVDAIYGDLEKALTPSTADAGPKPTSVAPLSNPSSINGGAPILTD